MGAVYFWTRHRYVEVERIDLGQRTDTRRPASSLAPHERPGYREPLLRRPTLYEEWARLDEAVRQYVRANPGRTRAEIAAAIGCGPCNFLFMDALADMCVHDNAKMPAPRRWYIAPDWDYDAED